jgi:hypothetical protein
LAQISGSIRIPPNGGASVLLNKASFSLKNDLWISPLGTRRRDQIGRGGGNVPARLNAVFAEAVLTFPAKSST